jgi:hypothetical protein
MTDVRLSRAADAASYAGRLQAELIQVTAMLDRYRGSPGLELMRDQSLTAQRKLGALADRLRALGETADPGRYPLSQPEHVTLETALDLRDRLVESLARYERAEKPAVETDSD